jgi:phage baseplate assembly protein V
MGAAAQALARAMAPLAHRVRMMLARAVVSLVRDGTGLQSLQVELLEGEVREDCERVQNYGFTSHPHPGAEAVAACVGGNRDHVLVLAVDDRRFRLKPLAQGEVALYTDEGDKVVLKRGGVIELTAASKVRIVTPLVEVTGNVTVAGSLSVQGSIDGGADITAQANVRDQGGAKTMAGMRAVYNSHTHGSSPVPNQGM